MDADQPRKKGLTQTALNTLLARLGSDKDIAAQKYELLRRKLIAFFEWQGSRDPGADADETFDRVARKLCEGEDIVDISTYTRGVAGMIKLERIKAEKKTQRAVTEMVQLQAVSTDDSDYAELLSRCLEQCLDELPDAERKLILKYYSAPGADRIALRSDLAEEMQISINTLRIRTHKIKRRLQICMQRCVERVEGD